MGFPFGLLCDTERELGLAYGACSEPTADFARRITVAISAESKILHVWDDVHVKSHAEDVLVLLRELV